MEGNEAVLFQVADLDAWWGQDNEGKPWPPAGHHLTSMSKRIEVLRSASVISGEETR
jgi:hypothetical protein